MSAHMRKRPTEEKAAHITWHGMHYRVPLQVMKKYQTSENDDSLSINDVFGGLIDESGEPALLLKGLRYKEGLSQVQFAKKIGVSQANLSAMENGRRSIGKEIAKRIAKCFKVDYRLFL